MRSGQTRTRTGRRAVDASDAAGERGEESRDEDAWSRGAAAATRPVHRRRSSRADTHGHGQPNGPSTRCATWQRKGNIIYGASDSGQGGERDTGAATRRGRRLCRGAGRRRDTVRGRTMATTSRRFTDGAARRTGRRGALRTKRRREDQRQSDEAVEARRHGDTDGNELRRHVTTRHDTRQMR